MKECKWVERARHCSMLESHPGHFFGGVRLLDPFEAVWLWWVSGTTAQGSCRRKRLAQDKVEEFYRLIRDGQ